MLYPTLQEVSTYREMTTAFGGYNHQLSCQDGQFFDMKNITSQYFPILSPRQKRGIVRKFANPQGILDKEDLMWIDDGKLYINGEEKSLNGVTLSSGTKTLAKMGAYVIIMPDKIWYNTEKKECGNMESTFNYDGVTNEGVEITICEANGKAISYRDAAYYETNAPKDGDYMMSAKNGKPSLKVYSASTKVWLTVASTYVQITVPGIGTSFEKGDGVKISIYGDAPPLQYIFVNEEDGFRSTNTTIVDKTDNSITIPGIIASNNDGTVNTSHPIKITVERKVPDMAFITECNNRLWGCSKDGHEVYCCKLGDVKNWNCFAGISTDSWAATIGSDGKFTGAITYLGYPMFFKEDSFIKIAVSSNGGHQLKETKCRGVQNGSHRSLSILNETLYYKSTNCVCGYNGSLPVSISDELGEIRYSDAVAGTIDDRYYISMKDEKGAYHLFVYDTKNGIWCKEDNTEVLYFCKHKDDLYYIDIADNTMKSVRGTLLYDVEEKGIENDFKWFVESGTIGYSSPDNKYVSRINMRITLECGANVDFYLQYDSSGVWEHKFNMSGKGTKTFTVPIIPKRCDHFKYKITGKGECKIHSIAKTLEEGSDI
jgi:hypothetical protein